jgi:hypothetical protein
LGKSIFLELAVTTITYPSGITGPLPPSPPRRFTVEEYEGLIDSGFFASNERTELLEGQIIPKMPHNPPHDIAIEMADDAIRPLLPSGWRIRIQSAIQTVDSQPEPDLAICTPLRARKRRHPRPADIATVIEVADATLLLDRRDKATIYARARIPIYWIINLVDNQVEVYTDPNGSRRPKYRRHRVFGANSIVPLVIDGKERGRIPVRDLLPS